MKSNITEDIKLLIDIFNISHNRKYHKYRCWRCKETLRLEFYIKYHKSHKLGMFCNYFARIHSQALVLAKT